METWENLQVVAALMLAITAAVMSSGPVGRRDVRDYLSAVFGPQMADLGSFSLSRVPTQD